MPAGVLLYVLAFVLTGPLRGQEGRVSVQIRNEIARLRKLEAIPDFGPSFAERVRADAHATLRRSERAVGDGNLYLGLLALRQGRRELLSLEYGFAHFGPATATLEGFESHWREMQVLLKEQEKFLGSDPLAGLPLAVRALAESSWGQVWPHHAASLVYGRNTTVESGRYYLGRALAQLEFVKFCRSLEFAPAGSMPPLPDLASTIAKLEEEVTDAYRPPASIELHSRFIRINSALKLARELHQQGRTWGAIYQYLEARLEFGLLRRLGEQPVDIAELRGRADSLLSKVGEAEMDHSLARLYWEQACALLAASSAGDTGREGPLRAEAILDDVLPHYFQLVQEN